jgi:DNA-binding NarL/FixJ family response regulator
MPAQQTIPPALTLTRAISPDGQTSSHDQAGFRGGLPIVGIVSAYRYQRLRLSLRLDSIPGFRMAAMAPTDVTMPKRSVSGLTEAPCNLLIVEPGDLANSTLEDLVQVARRHALPLIWLGEPPIAQRLATSSLPGGMIPPQSTLEQIERTLQGAAAGLHIVHPDFVHVTDQTEPADDPAGDTLPGGEPAILSPREQEVLTQVANGLPNKAIARMLGITDHTVKFHVGSVLSKLEAASRSEAVAIATRRGMLDGTDAH